MSSKLLRAVTLVLAVGTVSQSSAFAQENDMKWSFSQNNAASTAGLTFAVPETDNIAVSAACGGAIASGTSQFTIAANYGSLTNGTPTRIRFSGNGNEYEIDGTVSIPASGEGLYGVKLTIPNDNAIWAAFDSNEALSYQVPGFAAAQLPLIGGQADIRNFINACRFLASGNQNQPTTNAGNASGGLTEKEAFNLAKDLNSPQAWQAFLRVYPTGFFAELAQGYLAQQTGGQAGNQNNNQNNAGNTPPPPPPTPANLPYVNPGMDSTPWYNFNYSQDEGNASSYAAGVRARGVEFFLWCGNNRRVNFGVREQNRGIYPAFDQRARQAASSGQPIKFTTFSGGQRSLPMSLYELNGEIGIDNGISPNDRLVANLMKDNSFLLENGPLGFTFQLKKSRSTICNVLNRCGAVVAGCQAKPVVRKVKPKPKVNRVKCRSRSVWVEGRGCILKKYANTKKRKSRCARGHSILDGRCIKNSQRRSFCGPGYTPKGSRCVSNANVRPRYQQGVYVTEPYCNRLGLTKEGNYCVEDD